MKRALPSGEVAAASKLFEKFFAAEEFEDILYFHNELCNVLKICPGPLSSFYNVIKTNVRSLCAQNLFTVLDAKIKNECYSSQYACSDLEVVVVGCGPCGLRYAIETQLLGGHATVIEKRTSFTRNNVLHLWPFVIEDLKMLGTKQFFPKFCTGSMNHISIRRIQSILLKVSLVLGAQVYRGVEFCGVEEPDDNHESSGWRISVNPPKHPVNLLNVDVLIGAEGKRVSVPGFKRKEFRGKLAIAITANFKNRRTTAEAVVEEISGVAFVYKQDFFNNLYEELGIALENIVYYKDETHYFVMTTKKHSLLDRGVLKEDHKDPIELLSPKNTNKKQLLDYIKDASDYCTDYQLPDMDFALNHHGEPDVALFDFTSMFQASNSCYVKEKHGKQLLLGLVGDGLLEPFWPTGSGCARGFLGVLDTCYAMQEWCEGHKSVLQILAERESIFRLLPQTTSENLIKDHKNYNPDPGSRYPHYNKYLYAGHQMQHLYLSDELEHADLPRNKYIKMQKKSNPATSRLRLAQQMQQSQEAQRRSNVRQYSDDDEEDDERICEIDKRIEMRKKMLAEEKAQNDPSQYFTNRAKMLKDKQITSTNQSNSRQSNEKVNRLEAMAKISETFGYGERIKKESPPLKKPLIPTEPKQNRRKVVRPPRPTKDLVEVVELGPSRPKAKGGVKKWDFDTPSKPPPRSKKSSLDVDPELDGMLAQLESDAEFSKLSDNEQIAWLESLFFLDTPSKQASSGLVKPRVRNDLPSGESRRPVSSSSSTMPITKVDTSSSQVSSKSLSIQNNGPKRRVSKPEPEPELDAEESDSKGAMSKDKMALAMSFFANDSKAASSGKKATPEAAKKQAAATKKKATSTASTSSAEDELPVVHNATAKPFSKPTRERAYFEPEGSSEREDEEEDFVPNFAARRKSSRNAEVEEAPPVPSRSGENKHLMLKLMKNATNALKSK